MVNPIQIILNPENFSETREVPIGGSRKDFFKCEDSKFVHHRASLIQSIDSIINILEQQPEGPIGYLKVTLRQNAWAKSHRPTKSLFKPKRTPIVGGMDIGVMLFEVDSESLTEVREQIVKSETVTQWKEFVDKTDVKRVVENPSVQKSETGAIEQIELYDKNDKRDFTPLEAVEWLTNSTTGGNYEVELFQKLLPVENMHNLKESHRKLQKSLLDGFREFRRGLEVSSIPSMGKEASTLAVKLNTTRDDVMILLEDKTDQRQHQNTQLDVNSNNHLKLLNFLESHPLVKSIELPGVIVQSDEEYLTESAAPNSTNGPTCIFASHWDSDSHRICSQ